MTNHPAHSSKHPYGQITYHLMEIQRLLSDRDTLSEEERMLHSWLMLEVLAAQQLNRYIHHRIHLWD